MDYSAVASTRRTPVCTCILPACVYRLRTACAPQHQGKQRLLEYRCNRYFYVDSVSTFVPVPGVPQVGGGLAAHLAATTAPSSPCAHCPGACAGSAHKGVAQANEA